MNWRCSRISQASRKDVWSKNPQQGWTKKQSLIKQYLDPMHAFSLGPMHAFSLQLIELQGLFHFGFHDFTSWPDPVTMTAPPGLHILWIPISRWNWALLSLAVRQQYQFWSPAQLNSTDLLVFSLSHHLICNQSSSQHQCICGSVWIIEVRIKWFRDFPSGPMVKIPHSQCRGPGFKPWSGN